MHVNIIFYLKSSLLDINSDILVYNDDVWYIYNDIWYYILFITNIIYIYYNTTKHSRTCVTRDNKTNQ